MKSSRKKALKSARKRVIRAAIGWAEASKREMDEGCSLMTWGLVVRREQSLERAVARLHRCMEVAK